MSSLPDSSQYEMSPLVIGLIFSLSTLSSIVSIQVYALVSSYRVIREAAIPLSLVMSATAMLLYGPMYPVAFDMTLSTIIVIQILLGMSQVAQLITTVTLGLEETLKYGFTNDVSTKATFTAMFNTALAFGYIKMKM